VLADNVSRAGVSREYKATAADCTAVAEYLGIQAVNRLSLTCRLSRRDSGRIRVRGTLEAEAVQACVVTCEPVTETVREDVEADFAAEPDEESGETDLHVCMDDTGPPELMTSGRVELGALAVELLSLSLDPYPRAPGAEFRAPADDKDAAAASPFAALSALKRSAD
jgi:hypothetical protein